MFIFSHASFVLRLALGYASADRFPMVAHLFVIRARLSKAYQYRPKYAHEQSGNATAWNCSLLCCTQNAHARCITSGSFITVAHRSTRLSASVGAKYTGAGAVNLGGRCAVQPSTFDTTTPCIMLYFLSRRRHFLAPKRRKRKPARARALLRLPSSCTKRLWRLCTVPWQCTCRKPPRPSLRRARR